MHDAAAEQASQAADTTWKSASPVSIISQQTAYFSKLSADEVSNAKIEIASQRDLQLVQLLDNDTPAVIDALETRLTDLTGTPDYTTVASLQERVDNDLFEINNNVANIANVISQMESDAYPKPLPTCDDLTPPSTTLTENQSADLQSLSGLCKTLGSQKTELSNDLHKVTGGQLADTINGLNRLSANLKAQEMQAAALKRQLKQISDQVNAAKKGASGPIVTELQFCLADPSSNSTKDAATHPTLSTELPACAVEAAHMADPVVKQLKHTALSNDIQSVISSLLQSNASTAASAGTPPNPAVAAATAQALGTISSLSSAASALLQGKQPSVNALLVALAYEQYQSAIYAAQVASLNERITLYERRRDAEVTEISYVAQALQELAKPEQPSGKSSPRRKEPPGHYRDNGRVLAYVNASWNLGAYPVLLSEYSEDDLIRADALQTASIVVGGWQNTLQPAFDELVAYGQGGLDAQTMSNLAVALINAGGFAAVAKGVN